jgi:UDP-glucose 4-epimerase
VEKRKQGVFIYCDPDDLSTTEIVNNIALAIDRHIYNFKISKFFKFLIKKLAPGLYDRIFSNFRLDNTLTCEVLNFKPEISTIDGLKRMSKWYLENL